MWKDINCIAGMENIYEANKNGQIRNKINGIILKYHFDRNGYYNVNLYNPYTKYHITTYVHKIIAKTFIPNPEHLPYVIFLDNDKSNINVSNLQWSITRSNYTINDICKWVTINWIPRFEGLYQVNEYGNVRNVKTGRLKTPMIDMRGYLVVSFSNTNNDVTTVKVHRLVAEAFIPNPNNYPFVMHKDNNKLNPHVSNLEWGTCAMNTMQAYKDGLIKLPDRNGAYYMIYRKDKLIAKICHTIKEVSLLINMPINTTSSLIRDNKIIPKGHYKGYSINRIYPEQLYMLET